MVVRPFRIRPSAPPTSAALIPLEENLIGLVWPDDDDPALVGDDWVRGA